ncbi:MAG: substrate-binding domain-containing protein [Bacteroidia bacterium]|nr:substrate-binding domain-containing protein [Bacteroidia bacterium]
MNRGSVTFWCLTVVLAVLLIHSCSSGTTKRNNSDTPTSGSVRVGADDSYRLIMDAEEMTFEQLYVDADVHFTYTHEDSLVGLLLKDSIRFAILSRKLTAQEEQVVKQRKVDPTYIKIAYDGVALIVHPDNKLRGLSVPQIRQILSGELQTFAQLDSMGNRDSLRMVFDHALSCNARYMKDSLMKAGAEFPGNCFAVKSNEEVINYVAAHPNTIGVIGVNWLSDRDDSLSNSFLKKVRVLPISAGPFKEYFEPYQAYLAQGQYPLIRDVYIVKVEVGAGLGTGFAAFIAGEKGQRIILKSGLVPATMPLRIVEVKQ